MLYLYDRAVVKKLQNLYPRVIYAPVNQVYQRYLGANQNQLIQFPALSVWRVNQTFNPFNARSQLNTPSMRNRVPGRDQLEAIYSMQIPLTYQLDIWTKTDIDRDDMFTELMYALTLYPDIVIVYRGERISFPLIIESADDTTQINDFENIGDLFRMSISLTIESARLFFYQDTAKLAKYINTQITTKIDDMDSTLENVNVQVNDEEWNKFLGTLEGIERVGDRNGTQ